MTEAKAEAFVAAALTLDFRATLHPGYSGRGMFGRKTTGVVMASDRSAQTIVRALSLAGIKTDSLGLDVIVY